MTVPSTPWQCAATGSPRAWAVSTTTATSSALNCDAHIGNVGVSAPPVTMIFTTSQPRRLRSCTAATSAGAIAQQPPRNQQCPPSAVSGGPAARIVGSSGSPRRSRVTKPRSPRSRMVVMPACSARRRWRGPAHGARRRSGRRPAPRATRCRRRRGADGCRRDRAAASRRRGRSPRRRTGPARLRRRSWTRRTRRRVRAGSGDRRRPALPEERGAQSSASRSTLNGSNSSAPHPRQTPLGGGGHPVAGRAEDHPRTRRVRLPQCGEVAELPTVPVQVAHGRLVPRARGERSSVGGRSPQGDQGVVRSVGEVPPADEPRARRPAARAARSRPPRTRRPSPRRRRWPGA